MLVAFLGMQRFGVSGNLMSLGAIDFGLIVDGAVIVVENTVRLLAERSHHLGRKVTAEERTAVVLQASREVLRSATFGVIIIAIVYLPILSLVGIEGKMFRPMAMTVLFALLGALVLAMTFIPAMASWMLPRRLSEKESLLVAGARRVRAGAAWRAALALGGARPRSRCSPAAASSRRASAPSSCPSSTRAPSRSRRSACPASRSRSRCGRPPSWSACCASSPRSRPSSRKTGRAEIATDPMGVEISDVFVMLKPHATWRTATTREGLVEAFDQALRANLPGQQFSYSQPIELRVAELISGVRSDVALKIYGDDLQALERIAAEAVGVLQKVPGAADVKAEQTAGLPVLRVRIDRRAIARHGINAAEVLEVVATVGGREVGVVLEGQRRFALTVRFGPPGARYDRRDQGAEGPLTGGGADPARRARDDRRRGRPRADQPRGRQAAGHRRAQRARPRSRWLRRRRPARGRGLGRGPARLLHRLGRAVREPPGGEPPADDRGAPGAGADLRDAVRGQRLGKRLAAMVYLNVPFAVTGGLFALGLRGMPLSISAGVGFIALFGVAVLNGLVLISYIEERRRAGLTHATPPTTAPGSGCGRC
jgi:cobalt-zinc-cadmium resistance protein CzcA